jgi:hypothetical protein
MNVITTITITQKVDEEFEQFKRNYEREFGGTDLGVKKHVQKLIPVSIENIKVSFEIEEPNMAIHHVVGDNDEILATYVVEEEG